MGQAQKNQSISPSSGAFEQIAVACFDITGIGGPATAQKVQKDFLRMYVQDKPDPLGNNWTPLITTSFERVYCLTASRGIAYLLEDMGARLIACA